MGSSSATPVSGVPIPSRTTTGERPRLTLADSGSQERRRLERGLAGRYRIVRQLGRGGMSAVYLAWEQGLGRHVAIKVLLPAFARQIEDRERFRREARTAADLVHPGIVPVYGGGDADGLPYFVMRHVAGGSLAGLLEREPRLDAARASALLADLAEALDCAHQKGVIHRDVKPENILLDEDAGRPILSDFGVAIVRSSDHSRSEVSRAHGTPDYMSPEQVLGEQAVDGRSDLYALGVLGFRMLAGRLPFRGDSDQAIAAQHVGAPAPPLASVAAGLPPHLAAAVDRCLEKDPGRRFPDGRALAAALRQTGSRRFGAGWMRSITALLM